MILLYRIFTTILYPIIVFYFYVRKFRGKEDSFRFKEKIFTSNFNISRNINSKLIWFHCASIGEFKSIIPLIDELNKKYKNLDFLVTSVTLSSGKLAEETLKKYDNVCHRYFPVDVIFIIKKFLKLWKPFAIFLVDSEIWPNLILNAKQNKIPIALINARLTSKSYSKWMLFPKTSKTIFNCFDLCLSSNIETSEFLKKMNLKKVLNLGNMKLFSKLEKIEKVDSDEIIFNKKKFWFAMSTHKDEETYCLKVHSILKKNFNEIFLIIAPRHIERVEKIKKICENFNFSFQIIDKKTSIDKNKDIIIVNSFGALPRFLKYAKSVFVGKSLIKKLKSDSGQNPIEAVKLGCKIYHGPYVSNFKEIYDFLSENKIANKINDPDDLVKFLIDDFNDHKKDNLKNLSIINNLEKKTLSDTIKNIEIFLFHENF